MRWFRGVSTSSATAGDSSTATARNANLVVHDYSGHPFQVQLSRELALLGHDVLHQFCSSYSTGRGAVSRQPGDPENFRVEPIPMRGAFARYSPLKRVAQEIRYGLDLGARMREERPDALVLCNVPLLAHLIVAAQLRVAQIPMLFWQQDVYSEAIGVHARRVLGPRLGGVLARRADRVERWIARRSAHVVAIAEEFRPVLARWGVRDGNISVIPNWAALQEIPLQPKDNEWARQHGLAGRPVILYAGTLGLKHNPAVFVDVARELANERPDARVVVLSEGKGRNWLEHARSKHGLDNLMLMDFQPYADLPSVLAAADVLVSVLEPDASRYSVPSKVLNYLCAGRCVLGVMPSSNGAARTLLTSGAGIVVPPGEPSAVTGGVLQLLADPARRAAMGRAGRRYAEVTFAIRPIALQFQALLRQISNLPGPAAEPAALPLPAGYASAAPSDVPADRADSRRPA